MRALNLFAAGEQGPGNVDPNGWDLGHVTGTDNNVYTITDSAQAGDRIAVTLSWFRYTSATDDNLLGHNWQLDQFEDLDLYLRRDSDNVIVAQSISPIDSVEHIYYQVTQEDSFSIIVNLFGAPQNSDDYGLAWSTTVPEPTTMALTGIAFTAAALWRRRKKQ